MGEEIRPEYIAERVHRTGKTRFRNINEHPLERLYRTSRINRMQFTGGNHFRADFERASISHQRAVDLARTPSAGGAWHDLTPAQLDGLRAVERCLESDHLHAQTDRWLALHVCGMGYFINQLFSHKKHQLYYARRLVETLDHLVDFYGI